MNKNKLRIDWLMQGHCMNCGQVLNACLCVLGPLSPLTIKELQNEKEAERMKRRKNE